MDVCPGATAHSFLQSLPQSRDNQDTAGRRVSATPVASTPDGFFPRTEKVVLDLQAQGQIYYTFDATMPTQDSLPWVGPTEVPATCVIRAIARWLGNALPSRPLTLNYFIGETFALPVLSLVSDDKVAFYGMYNTGWKDLEWGGNIAWYDESGSFSAPCGISDARRYQPDPRKEEHEHPVLAPATGWKN